MGSFAAGFLLHRGWFRSGLSTRARAGSINLKGIRIFRCVEFVLTRWALCNTIFTTKVVKEIDMGMPVRIEDDLYRQAKAASQGECRTIAGQLEFWAKVGKAALDNPDLPIEFVSELLVAKKEDRSSLSVFTPGQFRD